MLYSLTYKVLYMKRVNFRISETTYDQLKQLAEQRGESMNAAVQYAVQSAVQLDVQGAVQNCVDEVRREVQENPGETASETDWKALYFAEKERVDGMSAKLLELSGKVADSLQAAQVLQALGKPTLESAEQKKGRWARLRDAWRG